MTTLTYLSDRLVRLADSLYRIGSVYFISTRFQVIFLHKVTKMCNLLVSLYLNEKY